MLALGTLGYMALSGKGSAQGGAQGGAPQGGASGGFPGAAPEPVPLPGGDNALGVVRAPDGTAMVVPSFAASMYVALEGYTPQVEPSDPRFITAVPRGQFSAETARSWCDRVILDGGYVLMLLDPDRVVLRLTLASELALARGPSPSFAVFLSPPSGALPVQPPIGPGGVPGGGSPFPNAPGVPSGPPSAFAGLPPDLLAKVLPVYQSGSARQLKDLSTALARRYPEAAAELRHKSAERWEREKVAASLEGRLVRVVEGRYPSHYAQHYAGDFAAWPELLDTNPQLERVGNNLKPWKGEIVLPAWWHADRPPLAAVAAPAPKAKASPAPKKAIERPEPRAVPRVSGDTNGQPSVIAPNLIPGEELPS